MAKYIDADHLKVEIEKHIKEVKDAAKRFTPNIGFFDAKLSGIYDVIAIIDSLQQKQPEKPMNQEGLEKEIERWDSDNADDNGFYNRIDFARHFYDLGCRRTAEKYDEIEYNRQRAGESVCDELEKEMDRCFETMPVLEHENIFEETFKNIARHFAQWGAEHLAGFGKTLEIKSGDEVTINGHKIVYDKDKGYVTIVKSEESVPKDLEEAAWEYAPDLPSYNIGGGYLPPQSRDDLRTAFKDGAKWQADHTPLPEDTVLFNKGVEEGKRLMMEEAVEGRVSYFESRDVAVIYYDDPKGNTMCFFAPSSSLETGDKVKIIIVKEDKK